MALGQFRHRQDVPLRWQRTKRCVLYEFISSNHQSVLCARRPTLNNASRTPTASQDVSVTSLVTFGRSLRSVCSYLPLLSIGTAAVIHPAQALDTSTLLGDRAEPLGLPSFFAKSVTFNSYSLSGLSQPSERFGLAPENDLLLAVTQSAWQQAVLPQARFTSLSPTTPSSLTLSGASTLARLSETSEPTFKLVDRRGHTDSLATLVTQATTTVMASLSLDVPLSVGGSLEQTTAAVEPEAPITETTPETARLAIAPASSAHLPPVTVSANPLPFGRAAERQRRTGPSLAMVQQSPPAPAAAPPQPTLASRPQTTTVAPSAPIQPIAPPVPVQVARSIVKPPLPSNLDLPPLPASDRFLPSLTTNFIWPARGVFTSGFGPRWGRMHRGIDIAAPIGTPVYAAAAGVVTYSQWNSGGFGNLVEIRHADGTLTLYAHNHRNLVRVGQYVQQGEQIAEMGSTGRSTGPHVHFEIRPQGRGAVDPMIFLRRAQS